MHGQLFKPVPRRVRDGLRGARKAHGGSALSRQARNLAGSTDSRARGTLGASVAGRPMPSSRTKTKAKTKTKPGGSEMSTDEATVATLLAHGFDTVYALPGVHNDHLFDAFHNGGERLKVVHS